MTSDKHTIDTIEAAILTLQTDVYKKESESVLSQFDILFEEVVNMVECNKANVSHEWFSRAEECAIMACEAYKEGHSHRAYVLLGDCNEQLVRGSKAHQHKTTYIVDPDGNTTSADNYEI